MPEETKESGKTEKAEGKKKGLPLLVKIGLGCIIILVLLGVILALVGGFLFKKFGSALISKSIEQKTGIQTNLSDIEKGKITYTDPKTGAKLDIGGGTIPESFPKDFPVYPESKILSSLSGNQNDQGSGFWLTLATPDPIDKVKSYYETKLASNGWVFESTIGAGSGVNWTVSKGDLNGYLTIDVNKSSEAKETAILIVLGKGSTVATPNQ